MWPLTAESGGTDTSGNSYNFDSQPASFNEGPGGETDSAVVMTTTPFTVQTQSTLGFSKSFSIFAYIFPQPGVDITIMDFGDDVDGLRVQVIDAKDIEIKLNTSLIFTATDVMTGKEWNWLGVTYDGIFGKLRVWRDNHIVSLFTANNYDGTAHTLSSTELTLLHAADGKISCLQFYKEALRKIESQQARKKCGWPFSLQLEGMDHKYYLNKKNSKINMSFPYRIKMIE